MEPAIRVNGLSKRYRIGSKPGEPYRTLRESLSTAAAESWQKLTRMGGRAGTEGERGADREFWALKDVSFEVPPGEVVGIIGRNGAGKSTLLKILSRITEPTSGRAEFVGRLGSLLEVGTGFHPELTGRENIFLNGSILGMSRREIARRFDEIVAFSEVERFLDTPVKRYSSGMYVRLAFAVAAHLEPEVLVVDEVLAVGDTEFQKKCMGRMQDIGRHGRTVLFVSHNMTAVQQLCTSAILIASGNLIDQGSTEAIVSRYLSDSLSSEDGCFDLADHPARVKKHSPLIRQITLRNGDGRCTTQFNPDDALEAEITIRPVTPIRSPRVALAIEDCYGRRILTVASHFRDKPLADIVDECRVRCRIPRINLGSGRYLLSVSVSAKYIGLLDSLDCVAWFEVNWNNNYGNGELYHPVYGPVITESSWETLSQ